MKAFSVLQKPTMTAIKTPKSNPWLDSLSLVPLCRYNFAAPSSVYHHFINQSIDLLKTNKVDQYLNTTYWQTRLLDKNSQQIAEDAR